MNGSKELRKIEKEIIEARALIIKSNNITNSLGADMRSIAKRQSTYERNLSASSVVVYVIFAVLALIGAHMAYSARQSSLEKELVMAEEQSEKLKKQLDALNVEIKDSPEQTDKAIKSIFDLINEGKRQETLDAYAQIQHSSLSFLEQKLLERIVNQFKSELSMMHYITAMRLVGSKDWAKSVEEFKLSLMYKDDAGHTKSARINMANALRLQGKPREAIAVLQKVTEEHLDRELSDDALWYLAKSHEDAHQKDEALSVLKALLRRHPDSQYYRTARVKAAELKMKMWRNDDDD